MSLFEIKAVDTEFYEKRLRDFLPDRLFDIHTHVWLDEHRTHSDREFERVVSWPSLVAKENPIEDLQESYRLMFPDKQVTPLIFSSPKPGDDLDVLNDYIRQCAQRANVPALIFSSPKWDAETFERKILEGRFRGAKGYLSLAPSYLPREEIRIFDFFPHHQLKVLNRHGWIMMLHIPRDDRLRDRVNLTQLVEIEQRYPKIRLIVAHVGRAYCVSDVGDAFGILSRTERMCFDISANTNSDVFEMLIRAVGARRILFGSDLPILRMRMHRICEGGIYINIVPKGLYGDVSGDPHMREVEGPEADSLTFFMYEEIDAFRRAAEATGLSDSEVEDVFYANAATMLEAVPAGPRPQQLQMVWPRERLAGLPPVDVPTGYELRNWREGDVGEYVRLMHSAGFEQWSPEKIQQNRPMWLPGGPFFVEHRATGHLVATAVANHRPSDLHPFGGELGWVASDPAHRGKRLGRAVCAAVLRRFIEAGYQEIYLQTDDWRLPAIKTYLNQGWAPLLHAPDMEARWRAVCDKLAVDFGMLKPVRAE